MAHYFTDGEKLKATLDVTEYNSRLTPFYQEFLRQFLTLIGMSYEVVFSPCEQQLHALRDRVYKRQFYLDNHKTTVLNVNSPNEIEEMFIVEPSNSIVIRPGKRPFFRPNFNSTIHYPSITMNNL
jgi:hypothetical protein